jgi:hypothetical protein
MRRCTGLRSRLSYFSITGWNFTHLAQGYPELEGQFKTVAYDARGWGKSDKTNTGRLIVTCLDRDLEVVGIVLFKRRSGM